MLLFFSCKKDTIETTPLPAQPGSYPFVCEDTALNRKIDTVSQWANDINYYGKHSVWRVLYDNQDPDIIYYLTTEASGNPHHLWKYNRKTKTKTWLDKNVLNNIRINRNGWLAYDKFDLNIYKIKTNGDSLTQLTSDGGGWPEWSEDGNYLFYLSRSSSNIFKINNSGVKTDSIPGMFSFIYPIKNFIYYFRLTTNAQLVRRNLTSGEEMNILTKEVGNPKGESIDGWYTDPSNSKLFWFGSHGLSETKLYNLDTKQLVHGGLGSHSQLLHFVRSNINGQFIAVQFNDSVANEFNVHYKNHIVEFSADGKCRRKVEIPD